MWVELKVKLAKHLGEAVVQNHLVYRLLYGFHLHKKTRSFSWIIIRFLKKNQNLMLLCLFKCYTELQPESLI